MVNPSLSVRIARSIGALAICWFVSGVALGLRIWDIRATFLFFFWSLPLFAVGWMLVGIPIIAMGSRILRIPKLLLGIAGAIAGASVILLPTVIGWAISLGTEHFVLNWTYLKGWPAFGAAIGAGGLTLYSWLFSREINRTKPQPKID